MTQLRLLPLIIAFALSFATAGLGQAFTHLDAWYFALRLPAWKPPDVAFGVIWTTIFTLAAFSAWRAWLGASTMPGSRALKRRILLLFGANALLNIVWSLLYFTWHRPDWALIECVGLWLSIVALIIGLWRLSRVASLLLVPYVIWVSAAFFLNLATVQLNGPFG